MGVPETRPATSSPDRARMNARMTGRSRFPVSFASDRQPLRQRVADDVDIAALGRGVECRTFAGRLRQRIRARRQQG